MSAKLRALLHEEAVAQGARVHNGGTYVCMDGPAFSTRAESNTNRQLGFDVIGMTNLPEAKLSARPKWPSPPWRWSRTMTAGKWRRSL